ncbi:hypothetical protein ACFQY5_23180 [Paeniroseomonas aquatica]|uniref:hypothetical protein n=1 Tax=Paeniroseomonas aquatica TaxID=373043 RepID=UPI00361070F3
MGDIGAHEAVLHVDDDQCGAPGIEPGEGMRCAAAAGDAGGDGLRDGEGMHAGAFPRG